MCEIPPFLRRSAWTAEQKQKADKLWDQVIAEAQEKLEQERAVKKRKEEIRNIRRELSKLNRSRVPGSVSDKIAKSLERKLAKLRAENEKQSAA